MKIECTPEELKELMSRKVNDTDTTNVVLKYGNFSESKIDWALQKLREIRKQEHNCHCTLVGVDDSQ